MSRTSKLTKDGTFKFDNLNEGNHIIINGNVKTTNTDSSVGKIWLRFNNDSDANYLIDNTFCDALLCGKCNTELNPQNFKSCFSSFETKISHHTDQNTEKSAISTSSFIRKDGINLSLHAGLWIKKEPIVSIEIFPDSWKFAKDSIVTVLII